MIPEINPENPPEVSDPPRSGPAPRINRAELILKIDAMVQETPCAAITTQLSDNFKMQINGHIGNHSDLVRLKNQLTTLTPIQVEQTNVNMSRIAPREPSISRQSEDPFLDCRFFGGDSAYIDDVRY